MSGYDVSVVEDSADSAETIGPTSTVLVGPIVSCDIEDLLRMRTEQEKTRKQFRPRLPRVPMSVFWENNGFTGSLCLCVWETPT